MFVQTVSTNEFYDPIFKRTAITGEMTVSVGMDQMRHHVVAASINVFLARVVEMELLQRVSFVTDGKCAAGARN